MKALGIFLLPFYIFSRSFYPCAFSGPFCGYLYCLNYRSNVGVFPTDCAFPLYKFKKMPKRQGMQLSLLNKIVKDNSVTENTFPEELEFFPKQNII